MGHGGREREAVAVGRPCRAVRVVVAVGDLSDLLDPRSITKIWRRPLPIQPISSAFWSSVSMTMGAAASPGRAFTGAENCHPRDRPADGRGPSPQRQLGQPRRRPMCGRRCNWGSVDIAQEHDPRRDDARCSIRRPVGQRRLRPAGNRRQRGLRAVVCRLVPREDDRSSIRRDPQSRGTVTT